MIIYYGKMIFKRYFEEKFSLIKNKKYNYISADEKGNIDEMFLLEKKKFEKKIKLLITCANGPHVQEICNHLINNSISKFDIHLCDNEKDIVKEKIFFLVLKLVIKNLLII